MSVESKKIAEFLGVELNGRNIKIDKPKSLDSIEEKSMVFALKYSEEIRTKLNSFSNIIAIVTPAYSSLLTCPHVIVDNPRNAFGKAIDKFFVKKPKPVIAKTAVIGKNVSIGKGVSVGEYSVIESDVTIGDDTEIRHHVVIGRKSVIGSNCIIRSHTIIGEESYGISKDNLDGPVEMIPQIGNVVIGDNVEIGSFNTILRGAIDSTVLCDNVKITHHINIAHNVKIGENTFIAACAEISGSVKIGKGVWIAPNSSVLEWVQIGDYAMIGIGAVVIRDVDAGKVVAGNPAKVIKDRQSKT